MNILGGPYDGMSVDDNDIALYLEKFSTTFLFPPFDRWDDVCCGRVDKGDERAL